MRQDFHLHLVLSRQYYETKTNMTTFKFAKIKKRNCLVLVGLETKNKQVEFAR